MGMLPIRKINPYTVALTSYYGKLFVSRSTKKVNDNIDWIARQIIASTQDTENGLFKKLAPSNVFDNTFKSPRIYSGLSKYFTAFKLRDLNFNFDHLERIQYVNNDSIQLADIEGSTYRVCGNTDSGLPIVVDYKDNFFIYNNGQYELLGSIFKLGFLDETKAPVDFAELKLMGKTIPVGIILAYVIGFDNLIKLLKVNYRTIEGRQRAEIKSNEWVISFKDKKFIFSREDRLATLILGGFNEYWKSIKNYHADSFNKKNVHLNVLETNNLGIRYLRELELLEQLFIDPITRDILKEMNEPLTFHGLIYRSCELLLLDNHPDSQDMTAMRIKGYERFAGTVYKELITAIREYKARNIRGKSQISMSVYSVWRSITQDPSVEIVKDINPIENLKQMEAVTYVGEGGRSKDAMNRSSRAFHKSDVGVISEATVDSGDVGINSFLSANPSFTSLRGLTKPFDPYKKGPAGLLSSSALIAPGSDHDD